MPGVWAVGFGCPASAGTVAGGKQVCAMPGCQGPVAAAVGPVQAGGRAVVASGSVAAAGGLFVAVCGGVACFCGSVPGLCGGVGCLGLREHRRYVAVAFVCGGVSRGGR